MKRLLVIESPNKIKTLTKYLPKDFEIFATIGHIRDLSRFGGLGFDPKTFEPKWIVPKPWKKNEVSKREIINNLQKLAKAVDEIYLASDPDREGEAISWHVHEVLDAADQKKCKRIVFNEITKEAVLEAVKKPRKIDTEWVESQFARRIIDRMIGFRLSRFVQYALHAESAGRVQSVALKFIADREKEIENFKSEKWWTLDVILNGQIPLVLRKISDKIQNKLKYKEPKEVSGIDFLEEKDAIVVKDSLGDEYEIYEIDNPKYTSRSPKEPYKTSTMQQDAINKLGWTSKRTTLIAQRLYEGINLGTEHSALISYPRTDSTRLSENFQNSLKEYILKNFGENYLNQSDSKNKKSKKNTSPVQIQDAHEAIRPINIYLTPNDIKDKVKKEEYALYKLIWIRTVAAMMTAAKYKRVDIRFINNNNKFYATSRELIFDGYRKIYSHYKEIDIIHKLPISEFKIGSKFSAKSINVTPHESMPPPRYTQASLIASLEKAGIGRPSTYNLMANVALDRGYAQLEDRSFVPTELGKTVIGILEKHFPKIINQEFTKNMEDELDKIAEGEYEYRACLRNFWPQFEEDVKMAFSNEEKRPVEVEYVGRDCELCNKALVYKLSRYRSKFIGCSGYPECRFVEPLVKPNFLDRNCPECQKQLVERKNWKGQPFVGCSGYPTCRFIEKSNNEPAKTSKSKKKKTKRSDSE